MHPLAEKYLRRSALPTIFCPGCGHGTVLNAFVRAVDELDGGKDIALVSGIGCSGWTPVFVDMDTLHTLHGRAIAVATGLKLAAPSRKVVVFTGDGDCVSIGGNHFLHGARRNLDLTVIMMNNQIYGMTGGQVAPTTPPGARTQTSPHGNPEPFIDACELARCAGATFVARWTSAHPRALARAIKQGLEHKGFAFIEVMVQCPTQAGRYMHGSADPARLLSLIKEASLKKAAAEKMSAAELEGRFVVGTLHQEQGRPELSQTLQQMIAKAEA
ncbi:MAG: thiamine pyrophosphate-dependent enzyme [Desulfarculaceae bacterium]|jgi:2-oxoglutarate ferredoxin oxidoreductase subunit beta